ncbi:LAME_0D10814g1_1 [Lachancea meyersii CBS 8951]|uniref:LAME_0D10814g1_1 n=1 Tax=Lachancea meyersii CBS 8951 TaxID=1266667 RepID=A0A1G4JC07_9SACH|nr:LAME_0D10814g1_1 [Lachancea meyersii CBS 8951]
MKLETALPVALAVAVSSALVLPDVEKASHEVAERVSNALHTGESVLASFGKEITKNAAEKGESVKLAPLVVQTESFYPRIPHRYIVVFKSHVSSQEADFHREVVSQAHAQSVAKLPLSHSFFEATAGRPKGMGEFKDDEDWEIFGSAKTPEGGIQDSFDLAGLLHGYIGYFTEEVIDFIRMNPLVELVEQDSLVFAQEFDTQNGAPWGLSRISHREKLNLGSFNKYLYDDAAGKGVTSYVIDTGINVDHKDFDGRAVWGKTVPTNDLDQDGNGHGTHCAGTIASKHYGVAKNAEVVAVKVLRSNGSGSMSDVVKGVEFAAKSHQDAVKSNKKGFKGSTANMSLGGGKSPALDMAVNAAVKAGLHFAVAAGNENQDACNTSPAAAENAITVGASTLADDRAYFSNWGKCVDIFAPGLNVLSTYIGSETATATLSGTSMASPHVAGLLTYFLSLQPDSDSEYFHAAGGVTPAQLKKKLIAYSTKNVLGDLPEDTVNYLIYNGAGQDLDGFWSESEQEVPAKSPVGAEIEELIAGLDDKTDLINEEIREVFDKLTGLL